MSTTYTITTNAYDGYYTPSIETFIGADPAASPSPSIHWAVLHFGGLTWDHTLLTAGTFSLSFPNFDPGTYEVDVIVAGDGVPTGALIHAARRVTIGTLTITGTAGIGTGYIDFDTKVGSVTSQDTGTFTWVPKGAYTATGTANSDGFGTLNGAWTKHERDPADNTLFLGRSITLIIRSLDETVSGTIILGGVTGGDAAKLTVTTTPSNTGLTGTRYIRDWDRGRASGVIECPKTGWDIPADEAVRDGFTGMLVAPEAYDRPEAKVRSARPSNPSPRRRA